MPAASQRMVIESVPSFVSQEVVRRGWVTHLRVLGKTIFVVLQDCSGEVQCVAAPEAIKEHHLKLEDTVEIVGRVRAEPRAKLGYELDIAQVRVLNRSGQQLPFTCSSNLDSVSPETYSLDLELGFIDGPEDVIQLERELLTYILESVNKEFDDVLRSYREQPLPSMLGVPCWEFARCLELLKEKFDRSDLSANQRSECYVFR